MLYRKWRPGRFADIVGQQALTKTLSQAVAIGRVAHAYLFCGPRGTGKTSTARVLAKAVNCLNRAEGTGEPDGECAVCRAINEGNFVDLIEIDAASNRGIDEIRSLREKVHYAPIQAAMKVYIIDEAHMLTDAASNAFLKTLEEPPPQTLFVLCTTEPHKLPATIVSRCQRFDFHRITTADVVNRLAEIATAEGTEAPPEVLGMLARSAFGSLRDATNLLDQLITSYGTTLSVESVRELLGLGGEEQAIALVRHLLAGETAQALSVINAVAAEGADLRPLHRLVVDYFRAALLLKSGVTDAVDLSAEVVGQLTELVAGVPLEHILRALRLFGGASLRHDQPSPLPLELATVELSLEPEAVPAPVPAAPAPTSAPPARAPQARPAPLRAESAPPAPATTANGALPAERPVPTPPDPSAPPDERLASQWPGIVRALSRQKGKRFNVGALLNSSKTHYLDGSDLVVRFTHRSNTERLQEELEDPGCRLAIEKVLEEMLGGQYAVRVETDERALGPLASQSQSHLVRAAMNMGGQVVPEAHSPDPWEESTDEQEHAEASPTDSGSTS